MMSTIPPKASLLSDVSINKNCMAYDVYLGRGDVGQRLGNRIYHRMIKEYQCVYQELTCYEAKNQVAIQIINGFNTLKGTFYYKKNGIWKELCYSPGCTVETVLTNIQDSYDLEDGTVDHLVLSY